MALPIVFIHKGNSWYLPYTFIQARIFNPDSRLILLGDGGNRHFNKLVEHVDFRQYHRGADELAKVYVHESREPYDYELFCMQRWMILLEYMERNNLEQAIYLDSDVLLYSNLSDEIPLLPEGLEMNLVRTSAHTSYILKRSRLAQFCKFIMNGYTGPLADTMRQMWLAEFRAKHGNVGGNSDMTFIRYYHYDNPVTVADLADPWKGRVLDQTIDYHQGFEKDGNFKKLTWQGVKPFVQPVDGGAPVQMLSLHFQGKSKNRMTEFLRGWQPEHTAKLGRYKRILLFQRTIAKIKRMLKIG